ncbi:MAG: serine hydrolase [Candidatus Nanopelagicales bacterium]
MSTSAAAVADESTGKRKGPWRWIRWVLLVILILLILLFATVVFVLLRYNIPSNVNGLTAQSVCSGTFVAGRNADEVFTQDVAPQSPVTSLVSTTVDEANRSVSAKFLGMFEREAALLPDRGCVLDVTPDPNVTPYTVTEPIPAPWPQGDAAEKPTQWGPGVNKAKLLAAVAKAFEGAGDPNAANARAVAVVQDGRLLVSQAAPGFTTTTPLLGWSMTKTVNAMLFAQLADKANLDMSTKVVDVFPEGKEPPWVAQWRQDERSTITLDDLLFMRAGLDNADDYGPLASVVQMLYGEPSMADFAAESPSVHPPGTFWAYSTGISDIISQISRSRFPDDKAYWAYPKASLFAPIGADTASLFTDTSGTWVGGSYLWADVGDWAKLGQVMLDDGKWQNRQVLPAGFWKWAGTPAMPDGEGHGYGRQTWIPGQPVGGECANTGVPPDTLTMEGHYGQLVAMVPSKNAVVVRLGWTITSSNFDSCEFLGDVLAALPAK